MTLPLSHYRPRPGIDYSNSAIPARCGDQATVSVEARAAIVTTAK